MPTAAQWKVAVNAKRRKHCGQAGEAWAGGAWKQRWMAQAPTKGEQPSMGSRDGRAFRRRRRRAEAAEGRVGQIARRRVRLREDAEAPRRLGRGLLRHGAWGSPSVADLCMAL